MNKIPINTIFYSILKVLTHKKKTSQSSPARWNQDRNPKNKIYYSSRVYKICNEVSGKSWKHESMVM